MTHQIVDHDEAHIGFEGGGLAERDGVGHGGEWQPFKRVDLSIDRDGRVGLGRGGLDCTGADSTEAACASHGKLRLDGSVAVEAASNQSVALRSGSSTVRVAGRGDGRDGQLVLASSSSLGAQLLLFLALGVLGHVATHRLIPSIKFYMSKRGICGKDLGKKGTERENDDV